MKNCAPQQGCKPIESKCVLYSGSYLNNLEVFAGTNLDIILQKINERISADISNNLDLIGDVLASGSLSGPIISTLASSGVIAGTYGTSSVIPTFTVDYKGRITNVVPTTLTYTETDPVFMSQKGQILGVATLDANGLVPLSQLPPLGVGTVTSVGVTSSDLTVTNSPITTAGIINISLPDIVAPDTLNNIQFNSKGQVIGGSNVAYLTVETDPVYLSQKGQPNGAATLSASGKLTATQFPNIQDTGSIDLTFNTTTNTLSADVLGYNPTEWNTAYNRSPVDLTFNVSSGDLTLTKEDGTTIIENLDSRYILESAAGSFIQNQTAVDQNADFRIDGNGTIQGNLEVNSTTTLNDLVVEGNATILSTITLGSPAKGTIAPNADSMDYVAGIGFDAQFGAGGRNNDITIANGTGIVTFTQTPRVNANTVWHNGNFPLSISSPTSGQYLTYNGTSWVNTTTSFITSIAHNHFIANNAGTNQFSFGVNEAVRVVGAGDTTVSFNAGTKTITITSIPGSGGGGAVTSFNGRTGGVVSEEGDYNLTTLGDVSITTPATNQLLQYNGTNWVNFTPTYISGNQTITLSSDITGSGTTSIAATIANNVVTYAKMQDITAARLLGRYSATAGDPQEIQIGTGITLNSSTGVLSAIGTGGTVTSVGLSLPSIFTVSGSPVTTTGTLTGSLVVQSANTVFSGPVTGAAASPTFRSLVAADIPILDAAKITTGVFPVVRGGTGLSVLGSANQLIRVNAGATALEYFTPTYLTGNQTITLSGDVAGNGTTAITTTITNGAVTYAKIQNVTSTRLLGRFTGSNGIVQEIQVGSGLSLNSTTGVLSATGTGGTVNSVGIASTDLSVSGSPVTTSGSITLNINNNSVTYAKMQDVTGSRLLGRYAASTGDPQEIVLGTGLSLNTTTGQLDNTGAPASGSANYIQNQNAGAQTANFNISGNGTVGGTLLASTAGGNSSIISRSTSTGDALFTADVSGISTTAIRTFRTGGRTGIFNNANEAISILNNANVGFSIISPTAKVDIAAGSGFELGFTGASPANIYHQTPSQPIYINTSTGGSIFLGANGSGTQHLNVLSSGNVLIGTTTDPNEGILHVDGYITTNQGVKAITSEDLNLVSTEHIILTAGTYNAHLTQDGLGVGVVPNPVTGATLQVQGNVWGTDAYILGLSNTPLAEFGLAGSGAFVRTMGASNLSFNTGGTGTGTSLILQHTNNRAVFSGQIQISGGSPGAGKILTSDASGVATWETPASGGTVTSVGLVLPSFLTVSGSPVTTSGTFSATLASQTGGTVFAAPASTAGAPSFRGLVASDIPVLTASKISDFTTTVRANISAGTGISYNSTTGVITNSSPNTTPGLGPVLTVSNTADNNIVLGGAGITGGRSYSVIRTVAGVNYTALLTAGSTANTGGAVITSNDAVNPVKAFYIPTSFNEPRYSPDAGATIYRMWHENNHATGIAGSITYTGAEVPATFTFNSSGHYSASGKRNLTPSDIGAAASSIPLSTVLTNGNTANNSIILGAASNISQYSFNVLRNVSTVDYTGTLTITNAGTILQHSNGTIAQNQFIRLANGLSGPGYSPNNGANIYEIWHSNNHPSGSAFTPILTGANVPASFTSNSSGHVTGFTTRALTPTDIGAAAGNIPLQTVLSNGNTATNSITLGASGNTNGYFLNLVRSVSSVDYTATMAVGSNGMSIFQHSNGTPAQLQYIRLSTSAAAPQYSPNNSTNIYDMLHTGNHIAGSAFTPTLTGANVLSTLTVNSAGHISALTTRSMTASDIGAAPISGSTNYIQNTTSLQSSSNFYISGIGRTDGSFQIRKDGSNTVSPSLYLANAANSRAVNFQLNADTNPGLATWIHNGTSYQNRFTVLANGNVGMGVSAPTYGLQVSGDCSFAGGQFTINPLGQTVVGGTMQVAGTVTATAGVYIPATGIFQLVDNAGTGKVLTSDNLGNATWGTPTFNGESIALIRNDGVTNSFPTGCTYIIVQPTGNDTITLANTSTYPGATGRVVMIFNPTAFSYKVNSSFSTTSKVVTVVWTATDTAAFINL